MSAMETDIDPDADNEDILAGEDDANDQSENVKEEKKRVIPYSPFLPLRPSTYSCNHNQWCPSTVATNPSTLPLEYKFSSPHYTPTPLS
jgi:hypothetical protein